MSTSKTEWCTLAEQGRFNFGSILILPVNKPYEKKTSDYFAGYRLVPGYDKKQTSPDLQVATPLSLATDGTLNGDSKSTWTYSGNFLTMKWSNG